MVVGLGPDTVGMRSIENLTSAAVKSEPSWNFTPGRSLNSQVVSFSAFQLSARRGSSSSPSPDQTSVSNTCFSASACVPVAVKCGSIESGPPRTPIVRVWAVADVTSAMAHDKPMTSERIAFSWIGKGADRATRKPNLMRASGQSQYLLELIIGGIFVALEEE